MRTPSSSPPISLSLSLSVLEFGKDFLNPLFPTSCLDRQKANTVHSLFSKTTTMNNSFQIHYIKVKQRKLWPKFFFLYNIWAINIISAEVLILCVCAVSPLIPDKRNYYIYITSMIATPRSLIILPTIFC